MCLTKTRKGPGGIRAAGLSSVQPDPFKTPGGEVGLPLSLPGKDVHT